MLLKYGSYSFQANSLVPRMWTTSVLNSHNQVYALKRRVRINGSLIGINTADVSAQSIALVNAVVFPGRDLVYTDNNGAVTDVVLRNNGSMTGVHLAEPVDFNGTDGSELVTTRRYTCTFEAIYPFAGSNLILLDYRETLTFSGGGPLRVCKRAVNAQPQSQMPYQYTEYYAVQSGSAVGFRDEPAIPPPIWPNALIDNVGTSVTSPHPEGLIYTNFPITWTYRYVSPTPLIGKPSRWAL